MINHLISVLLLMLLPCTALAQRSEILSPTIASLQVMPDDDWISPLPVIYLHPSFADNEPSKINISFDELSHYQHNYTYKIEHCEADWTPSRELIESDFVDGFADGNTIDDCTQSINTNTLYTHYSLSLPNDRCRLKLSGNYLVTVFDEDDNAVLKACFMVADKTMSVGMSVTTNTDIDVNVSHQQVAMSLNYNNVRVTDPSAQIRTIVMQNGRWDNAVMNPVAQYVRADGLTWDHCRSLIFPAGNEYHKFEILDPSHTTMGLERVGWDGKQYHAWVWMNEPQNNYIYDEDANGAFCIRNSDNVENNTASDYILVHFRLRTQYMNEPIYLNGAWTQDRFLDKYRMVWNDEEKCYEAVVPLKQGYYSYQYLTNNGVSNNPFTTEKGIVLPSEGSFFQTENQYQALVYYRGQGERTDRLVAYATVKLK